MLRRVRLLDAKRGGQDVRDLVVRKRLDGIVEDLVLAIRRLPGVAARSHHHDADRRGAAVDQPRQIRAGFAERGRVQEHHPALAVLQRGG